MAHIYGLQYEFVGANGTHLLIAPTAEKSLSVIPHQAQMLIRNRIPGLLPFACEDWNGTRRLCYDVTSKRNLIRALRAAAPDQTAVFEIAYRLVKTIADSPGYLLNEDNYLLHEDFVYAGDRPSEIYLCYLPLENLEKPPLAEELRMLILRLAGCVRQAEGDGVPRLINALLAERLTPEDLKLLLREMWVRPVPVRKEQQMRHEALPGTRNGSANGTDWFRRALAKMEHLVKLKPARRPDEKRGEGSISGLQGGVPDYAFAAEVRAAVSRGSGQPDGKTQVLSSAEGPVSERNLWRLRIKKRDREEIVEIEGDRFLVGRSKTGVHYTFASESISRVHCEFSRTDNGFEVKDLGSLNGTLLNGEPLVPFKPYPFGSGDRVELPETEICLA